MTVEDKAPDLIMWVGATSYPKADDFIKESLTLGCSKRIPMLPKDIVPGKSRCFLAHDNGKKGQGAIFGFFVISGVEIILDGEEAEKYKDRYRDLNIVPISRVQAAAEPPRLCGQRSYGSSYLVSEKDMDKSWEAAEPLGKKCDIQGGIVVLLSPIQYSRMRFRGWRYMDPADLAHYDWPQRIMPVKKVVKVEGKAKKLEDLPLFLEVKE